MKEIIEFTAVFLCTVAHHLYSMVLSIRHPCLIKKKSAIQTAFSVWLSALSAIAIITFVSVTRKEGIQSIGINPSDKAENFRGAVGGFLWIAIVLIAAYFFQKWVLHNKKPNEFNIQDSDRPEVIEILKFKSGLERTVFLSTLPLRVIAEELVYRGYLILSLGSRTGFFVPWVIFSVFLSVIVHLYQGRKFKIILLHILLTSSWVGITLLTRNLFASIAAHLFNNLAFTINVWKLADNQGCETQEKKGGLSAPLIWVLFSCLNFLFVLIVFIWAFDLRLTVL